MRINTIVGWLTWSICAFGLVLAASGDVRAHCDGLDGPVVKAAQKALDTRDITPVLIWVQPGDEAEIRTAFGKTLAVRALSAPARELADRYFFETLVRVHRAGEGAPYTGLKPAGRDLGPAIPAADKAIEERSVQPVANVLGKAVEEGLHERFKEMMAAKAFKPGDVSGGREYVKAYVEFIHYVERLYQATSMPAHGHAGEMEEGAR